MSDGVTRKPDGSCEFTCTECGTHVLAAVFPDDRPVCGICRGLEGTGIRWSDIKKEFEGGQS